ncbi:MAG TPA: TolC family protein [Ohtaekwangia sp.]|uniref:TolC family protein n=1 Tax=Ohtaekwangia sp. TaxID=2066019 RepID=UPI002F9578AB
MKSIVIVLFCILSLGQTYAQKLLTLKESLQLAKKNNPDLKVASYNINSAEADITTAKIRPDPIFNMQLLHIADRNRRAEGSSWGNSVNGQYWWQVTKPLQVAGQRTNKVDLANKLFTQSKLDYTENSRGIFYAVANKWLDAWSAKIGLDILEKGKTNIDSLVQINEYRLRNKVITNTDLQRTRLLQQQYQRDIVTARQSYFNELQNLKYLLGLTDSVSVDFSDGTFNTILTAGDSLVEMGTHERSDVLAAKNAIDVSNTNMKMQRSFAYPQPEVGGMYNPQNNVPYFGFYGTVSIPIFNRNQGMREKAQVLKYQSEQNLWATERQAETEIMTAYRSYVTQRQNLEDYQRNLAEADNILNSVRYSYVKGGTSIIDLLEAQRSWLDTQQRYYSTMENFRRSYIQLLFATGIINQLAE